MQRAIKEDYSVLQLKLEKLDTDYTLMKDACFCSTYESRAKVIYNQLMIDLGRPGDRMEK